MWNYFEPIVMLVVMLMMWVVLPMLLWVVAMVAEMMLVVMVKVPCTVMGSYEQPCTAMGALRSIPAHRTLLPYCEAVPTSEVKRHRARLVLGWGTAWEDLRVQSALAARVLSRL